MLDDPLKMLMLLNPPVKHVYDMSCVKFMEAQREGGGY